LSDQQYNNQALLEQQQQQNNKLLEAVKDGKLGNTTIHNTTRYVLSLDEFLYWVKMIKSGIKNEMNIFGRKMTIADIVNEIKQGKL
jgi:hypothetical protein